MKMMKAKVTSCAVNKKKATNCFPKWKLVTQKKKTNLNLKLSLNRNPDDLHERARHQIGLECGLV